MTEITIMDNEYITMYYVPEKKTIYHTVHQPISGKPLHEALGKGFAALEEYNATK